MEKTIVLLPLLTICCLHSVSQTDGNDIVIGKYRKLHSAVTNEDRTLLVWLPRSYSKFTLSYPVLYLLYGQNTTAYLMPAITACDMLASSGVIPEMIIIGVANAERYRDYTSISDGYIENTVKFFTDELFPFVDENYRTKNYRIVVGPQAGAVFSFYTLLKHPNLFNSYITENPFVGQNRELLFRMAEEYLSSGKHLNKFLFISKESNRIPINIETAKKFRDIVTTTDPPGFDLYLEIVEPSGYFVPPLPVKEALLKLFREFAFPDTLKVKSVDEIKDFYNSISSRYGVEFQPPEMILTFKSDEFTSTGRNAEASELLEYQLSLYPASLNALMRMGDLKRSACDYESAIRYYDEFLEISSADAIAIRNRRDNLVKYTNESLVYQLEKDIFQIGIEKAVRNFNKTKASGLSKLTWEENALNSLGYTLLGKQMYAESIKVFHLSLEIYPNSANLYDSLGEAYMRSGDNKNAILSYEKSHQLNPGNENAKKMLEEIKTK